MNRFFELPGGESVGSFAVMLALAIAVGTVVGVRGARRAGVPLLDALSLAGYSSAAGFLGARLLYGLVVLAETGSFRAAMAHGGYVFYGAPLFGGLAFVLASRSMGLPILRITDSAIAAVPLAHGVGRLGCFLAGCCYGTSFDGAWAVTFTDPGAPGAHPSIPRHPVQLYEAASLFAIGALFVLFPPRHVGTGRRTWLYVGTYGALRFAVEGLRADPTRGTVLGVVSTSQAISALAVLGAALAFAASRRARRDEDPPGCPDRK